SPSLTPTDRSPFSVGACTTPPRLTVGPTPATDRTTWSARSAKTTPDSFPPPLAGEGQGGGFRLTPLRRPDRSGFSDCLSECSGFFERSIDFQGSSWWRSHSETFLMPTTSGRSPSLSTSDQVIGMAIGAPRLARTAYGATAVCA